MIGTEKLSLKQRDGRAGSGRVGPGRAAILISHRPNYKTLSLRSLVINVLHTHHVRKIKFIRLVVFVCSNLTSEHKFNVFSLLSYNRGT